MRRKAQQAVCAFPFGRLHFHYRELSAGQGAGLVEGDRIALCKHFQIVGTLHQHATTRCASDSREEGKRNGDDERAGAGHHQEGEPSLNPHRPAAKARKRRNQCQEQCRKHYDGRIHAGKAGDEVLGACLLLVRVFHQFEDAGHGRLTVFLRRSHFQPASQIDASRNQLVALGNLARHGFAREGRRIQGGRAGQHHAIERYPIAGAYEQAIPHGYLGGIDLDCFVFTYDEGELRCDIHHIGDGAARFPDGIRLEELAYLVEQHDCRALFEMLFGIGEQNEREST